MYACKKNLHPSTSMLQISASYSKEDKKASDLLRCAENASLIIIFDDPPNVLPYIHMCNEITKRENIHDWIIHYLVI